MTPPPPPSTLFPYTTLFRSRTSTTAPARRRPATRDLTLSAMSRCQAPDMAESRSEEHTSELQSQSNLVCRLLLEKKKDIYHTDLGDAINVFGSGSSPILSHD